MTLDDEAGHPGEEIAIAKSRVAELQNRIATAKSNIVFYKDVRGSLQQAKTPLEVAAASLIAVGKLREDGHISHEQFIDKLNEI